MMKIMIVISSIGVILTGIIATILMVQFAQGVPMYQTEFEWNDEYRERLVEDDGEVYKFLCPGTSGMTFTVNMSDYVFSQEYFDASEKIDCPYRTSEELVDGFDTSIENALEAMRKASP